MASESELSALQADAQQAHVELLEVTVEFHQTIKTGATEDISPVFMRKYQAERAWEAARDKYVSTAAGVRLDGQGRGA